MGKSGKRRSVASKSLAAGQDNQCNPTAWMFRQVYAEPRSGCGAWVRLVGTCIAVAIAPKVAPARMLGEERAREKGREREEKGGSFSPVAGGSPGV